MSSLAQQALDLSVTVQTRMLAGGDPFTRQNFADTLTAVQLLAQNSLSATPSTDTPDPSATTVDASTTTAAIDPGAVS